MRVVDIGSKHASIWMAACEVGNWRVVPAISKWIVWILVFVDLLALACEVWNGIDFEISEALTPFL